MERRKISPLVGEGLQRSQIEKQRRALFAGAALQRSRDEVADAGRGQDVLRGKQPVVGSQVGAPAQGDRFPQQPGAESPGSGGGHRSGEEHPDVGTDAGSGDLQRRRHPTAPAALT